MPRAPVAPPTHLAPKRSKSTKRSTTQPRKTPVQARSHDTVDVILAATRKLIIEHGVDHVSTNMVGRAAGVSIGSLYQYFSGKRALVAALRRRHQEEGERLVLQHAAELADAPVAVALRRLVEQMIALHRLDPALHRALELEGREPGVTDHEQRMLAVVLAYMRRHQGELCVDNLERAAYVVGRTIETLTHGAVMDRPELLDDQQLADDIIRMLLGYLTGQQT
jgi:AcrR family transcriptional regulator